MRMRLFPLPNGRRTRVSVAYWHASSRSRANQLSQLRSISPFQTSARSAQLQERVVLVSLRTFLADIGRRNFSNAPFSGTGLSGTVVKRTRTALTSHSSGLCPIERHATHVVDCLASIIVINLPEHMVKDEEQPPRQGSFFEPSEPPIYQKEGAMSLTLRY